LSTTTTFTEVTTKKSSTKMLPASTEENKFTKKSQTLTTQQSAITTKIDKTEAFSQGKKSFTSLFRCIEGIGDTPPLSSSPPTPS
uniref:Uncharacterized protein n=1 Tax=Meloidogyne floridensis TaxID=298350 RepID=A0A915NYN5_9BILA